MDDMGETTPPAPDQTYGERLTEQQYDPLAPMLKLHDHGKPEGQKLLVKTTPGEAQRRELKRRAVDALREHGTIGHAAAAAGVSPSTIYRWRDADPEFDSVVTEWMHVDQVDELHRSMYRIATNDDPKAANAAVKAGEFLLKSLDRKTYGDHQTVESTQTVNHLVQVVHTVRDDMMLRQQQALQRLRTVEAKVLEEG